MSRIRLQYVQAWVEGEGRVHRYFRRPGYSRVRLPGLPGSIEFMAAYQDALGSRPEPIGAKRTKPGSLDAALVAYFESKAADAFKKLGKGTQGMRRAIFERWRVKSGGKSIDQLPPEYITAMLSRMEPHVGRNWLKAIRHFIKWCIANKYMRRDPTLGFKVKLPKSDGIYCWSDDNVAMFEAYHPIGSKARLAMALGLYTAQRRGDVLKIGRQHIRPCTYESLLALGVRNIISMRQSKTSTPLKIPIHPELQTILDASIEKKVKVSSETSTNSETKTFGTLLVTNKGRPYRPNDFSEQFRVWCDAAGLPPECSFHGLRKLAGTRDANEGCTVHEIASHLGHKSLEMVALYTRGADQVKLISAVMERIVKKTVKPEPTEVSKPLRTLEKNTSR